MHFSPSHPTPLFKNWHWFALVAILMLAAFLRLYRLDLIPPGLHYDEAFDATQARAVLHGLQHPVFFPGNFGEEPMHIYVETLVFALVGESVWAARLSAAVLGFLVVPALYFCARVFFPGRRLLALSAALIGAFLYWAINFSRIGILTSSIPSVLTLSAGTVMVAYSTRNVRWGAAAGFLVGATLYTYLASRVWPLVILLWVGYLLVGHRKELRSRIRSGVVLAVMAILTVAPLVLFFLTNPEAFLGRAGQVMQPDSLVTNVVRTAGMFFVAGDTDPRDNLAGRPVLDPVLAVVFLVGLGVTVRRAGKPTYAFLLLWLIVMSLPSAVTEYAPNFRRALGAMPAVTLMCGVGVDWLWGMGKRLDRQRLVWAWGGLLGIAIVYSAWSNVSDYFLEWAPGSGLYYSFDVGVLEAAQNLAARPEGEQLCISPDYHDHPTVSWGLNGRDFSSFDGRRAAVLPNPALPTTCAIITYEDQTFSLQQFFPDAQHLGTIYDFEHRPYAQIFRIPAGAVATLHPQHPLDAQVGDAVRVLGYDLSRQSDQIEMKIYWRSERMLQEDYTVFVHLIGPANPQSESIVWSQDDAQPGHGTFPTTRWRTGQTIIDRYDLTHGPDVPVGSLQVEFGMYLLSTGERLPVLVDGRRMAQDRLLSGAIGD